MNKDGHIVGGYGGIVHSYPIVVYFTKSADVIVFRKNVFDHFPDFALNLGLEIVPETDQNFCLEKIGFFGFFVILCFYEGILALEILRKIHMKLSDFWLLCLFRILPVFTWL